MYIVLHFRICKIGDKCYNFEAFFSDQIFLSKNCDLELKFVLLFVAIIDRYIVFQDKSHFLILNVVLLLVCFPGVDVMITIFYDFW
jgi:hypothetical protein